LLIRSGRQENRTKKLTISCERYQLKGKKLQVRASDNQNHTKNRSPLKTMENLFSIFDLPQIAKLEAHPIDQ
jgi:hypothetical protein